MKLSKLGKAAQSCMMLDLAVTEEAEYASVRGATFVLPEELPRMGVVERLAAVLDIPESKRADIYMTTNEWESAQAVGGIDLRDHAAGELTVRELPLRLVRGGTELTPMLDSEGGLEMVDKSVLAPIEDELKNGEYITWYARPPLPPGRGPEQQKERRQSMTGGALAAFGLGVALGAGVGALAVVLCFLALCIATGRKGG